MPSKKIPKIPASTRALGRVSPGYPIASATLLIGRNKGTLRKENREDAYCRVLPGEMRQEELDEMVRVTRVGQFYDRLLPAKAEAAAAAAADKAFAASRVGQRGWYEGAPEDSAAFVFHHDPDLPGEASVGSFRLAMKRLAEDLSSTLCQDSVIVTFDTPDERKTRFVSTATDPKWPTSPRDQRRDAVIRARAQNAMSKRRR